MVTRIVRAKTILFSLFSLIAGYVLSCAVAVVSAYLLVLAYEVSQHRSSFAATFFGFFMIGGAFTMATAWPGFLLTHFLIWKNWLNMHPLAFGLAGLMTSIQAVALFSLFYSDDVFFGLWFSYPAGFVAGYVYGLFWHRLPALSGLLGWSKS